jgi:hypothetical protein
MPPSLEELQLVNIDLDERTLSQAGLSHELKSIKMIYCSSQNWAGLFSHLPQCIDLHLLEVDRLSLSALEEARYVRAHLHCWAFHKHIPLWIDQKHSLEQSMEEVELQDMASLEYRAIQLAQRREHCDPTHFYSQEVKLWDGAVEMFGLGSSMFANEGPGFSDFDPNTGKVSDRFRPSIWAEAPYVTCTCHIISAEGEELEDSEDALISPVEADDTSERLSFPAPSNVYSYWDAYSRMTEINKSLKKDFEWEQMSLEERADFLRAEIQESQ